MCAADITGTIVGTVADPSGAKIEGAQVSIISVDRGRTERSLPVMLQIGDVKVVQISAKVSF